MARKYAFINNNVVTDIQTLETDELFPHMMSNQSVIDIEDMSPTPTIGYVLRGNTLEIPIGNSDREQFEIDLGYKKIDFGLIVARDCVAKIGARNKILNKNGTQISAILTSLMPVKLLLETGALGTARSACLQLKVVYTEYADIFDFAINQVNNFESSSGL